MNLHHETSKETLYESAAMDFDRSEILKVKCRVNQMAQPT